MLVLLIGFAVASQAVEKHSVNYRGGEGCSILSVQTLSCDTCVVSYEARIISDARIRLCISAAYSAPLHYEYFEKPAIIRLRYSSSKSVRQIRRSKYC